jgi:hypothetical protein
MKPRSGQFAVAVLTFIAVTQGDHRLSGSRAARAESPLIETQRIESLTVAQAEQLVATTQERKLQLGGLTSLSADGASALSAFEGTVLHLNGLKQITPETARALATSRAKVLDLGGLARPSADVVSALGEFGGMGIMLGLDALSLEQARLLAAFKARRLRFTGTADLTVETATILATFPGDQLWFERGPTKLTPEVARAIVSFKGPSLALDGMTTLSTDAARELASFRGEALRLGGLQMLSGEAAEAIANFKGKQLDCHALYTTLMNVGRDGPLTLEQARSACALFRPEHRPTLHHLTAIDSPDAEAIARMLASSKARLAIPKLKRITPRALEALTANGNIDVPPRESLELVGE